MPRDTRTFSVLTLLLTAILGAAGCDENLSQIAGPTPNLEPTFESIQRDIFESSDAAGRSACVTCHTDVGRVPAGLLNLTHNVAYDQIVNAGSRIKAGAVRVVPGDPDTSYLVQKVEGSPGILGVKMPFGGPYLSEGQILILRRWIALGAPRS